MINVFPYVLMIMLGITLVSFGCKHSISFKRSFFGFLAFLPFCWLWGVEGFTWFSFLGTLYFVPVHWIFDKVIKDD